MANNFIQNAGQPQPRPEQRTDYDLKGYALEHYDRASDTLIVTFPPMYKIYKDSPRDGRPWGREFIAKHGYSALHVKTDTNCWFRRPSLIDFFVRMRDEGMFDGYRRVMTYGASMGGYGALAYAGLCKATHCLSLNPQVRLGPSVRKWETRFRPADLQDWQDRRLRVNPSLSGVKHLVTLHDPYLTQDHRHIQMIQQPQHVQLHFPFGGHRMPEQLNHLGLLTWLFDCVIANRLDPGEFTRRIRPRRQLPVWRKLMFDRAGESACRKAILLHHFPQGGTGIHLEDDN